MRTPNARGNERWPAADAPRWRTNARPMFSPVTAISSGLTGIDARPQHHRAAIDDATGNAISDSGD